MMEQRHQLVFPERHAQFTIHSRHENKDELMHHIRDWFNQGLPCIYARQLDDEGSQVNLGLPVLLANKKYRVGLLLSKHLVHRAEELPKLADMTVFFAKKLGQQAETLFSPQELVDFKSIFVFGSFLFESLTGQCFVTEHSDLDVLIDYDGYSLVVLRQLLNQLKTKFKRTIDGEIRFHGVGDVAINELLYASSPQLLFKDSRNAGLISRHELYAQYPHLLGL
ncbi:malonate decarboxylase holo-[acyl-carrier-protein] synthase [Legionella fallonii]|uniref:Phosphoribosyl-dephospho-CoA transferase n=1 Tax=Legionella fallonii LLAP-10 TaxID=1212491 RepID=A0A098G0X1_9GAMM|nr:malonate decarboxylase holo-[acyl-carrier-protein] synthase [Legionella fallonii]CEG55616.1 conserved protein of unknown function [Legionella fallonii LLAP-10]